MATKPDNQLDYRARYILSVMTSIPFNRSVQMVVSKRY